MQIPIIKTTDRKWARRGEYKARVFAEHLKNINHDEHGNEMRWKKKETLPWYIAEGFMNPKNGKSARKEINVKKINVKNLWEYISKPIKLLSKEKKMDYSTFDNWLSSQDYQYNWKSVYSII